MAVKGVAIDGIDYVEDLIVGVTLKEGRKANADAVFDMARKIRDASRKYAPYDTGTLEKAINARRGRRAVDPDRPYADVFITRGKKARHDAWYWFMLEHGTSRPGSIAHRFLAQGRDEVAKDFVKIFRAAYRTRVGQALKRRGRVKTGPTRNII